MSVLDLAIRWCGKVDAWLRRCKKKREQDPEVSCYDTLAPKTINNDSMQEYFSALKYALSKSEVRNIAVTGNYGAGKSTVISSFMTHHCNDKFINVSLAGFDMTENEGVVTPTRQEIELSILQQILYKENKNKLPDSRIDRIQNKNGWHSWRAFLSFLKVGIPFSILFTILFPKETFEFIGVPVELYSFINEHYFIKLSVLVFFGLITFYSIIELLLRIGIFDKKVKLNKIAFISGDVEVDEKDTPESLLSNCLDEIVYFFSRLKYKVVIFEDLDRLGTPEIFIKLREINKIINNNVMDGRPVRFIYAVRDDLFSGSNAKTKFFDFIMPVISFMDSKNSFTLLRNKMAFDNECDRDLKDISAYISNMRSLQNIVNEYHVFSRIVDNKKNNIRLLSIVFYKNIFALDYNLTDKKTGVLYSFIRDFRTRSLHLYHFELMEKKLNQLNSELEYLHREVANIPREVRYDIVTRFLPEILWGKFYLFFLEGYSKTQLTTSQLIENEEYFIDAISKNELYIGSYNSHVLIDINTMNFLREEYIERKAILRDGKEEAYRKKHQDIYSIKERIRIKNAISLKELVRLIGRDKFGEIALHYLDKIKEHDYVTKPQFTALQLDMRNGGLDALYVLLSNGLLLQDYMSYRSIFHEGSMTANDNDFIKAVGQDLSCKNANENYFIDDETKVINELIDQNRIYSDGSLHHQLISYLVSSGSEYLIGVVASLFQKTDEEIITVLSILYSRFSTPDIFDDFIIKSFKNTGYLDKMLFVLTKYKEIEFSTDIAISIISGVSPDSSLDRNEYLNFIHKLGSSIISLVPENKSHDFMKHILMADASYEELFSPLTLTEVYCLQFIAKHNLYKITKNNVGVAISCLLIEKGVTAQEALKKPWAHLSENNLNELINYYNENIDIFIKEVFVYSRETDKYIKHILINTPLSDESKINIIKTMEFALPSLSDLISETLFDINDDSLTYHDLFYCHDRVIPEWHSLLDYISKNYSKKVLCQYITKHSNEFGECPPKLYSDEHYDVLYTNIICNEEFDEPIYKNIVSSIKIDMNKIDSKLSVINFHRLVDMKKLALDENSYEMISSLYLVTEYDVVNDFIKLFNQNKNEFMNNIEFYLRKGKDEAVFEFLISEVIKSSLFDLAEKESIVINMNGYYIDLEINNINIPKDVIINIISNSVDIKLKVKLFIKLISMGHRDKLNLAKMCTSIDEKELKSVFTNLTKATFSAKNIDNILLILKCLEEANIIKNYTHRNDGKFEVMIKPGTDFDDD